MAGVLPRALERTEPLKTETQLIAARIHAPLQTRWPDLYLPKIPGTPYNRGLPDKMGCIAGIAVSIEAKKQGGKPTAIQEENLRQMAKAGGVALCVIMKNDKSLQIVDYTPPWQEGSLVSIASPAALLAVEVCNVLRCKDVQHVVPLYPNETPASAGTAPGSLNKKKPGA